MLNQRREPAAEYPGEEHRHHDVSHHDAQDAHAGPDDENQAQHEGCSRARENQRDELLRLPFDAQNLERHEVEADDEGVADDERDEDRLVRRAEEPRTSQLAPSKPTASKEPFTARRKKKIVLASR